MQWLHSLSKADPGLDRSAFIRPIIGWHCFRHHAPPIASLTAAGGHFGNFRR
jgi:hypothetical protein